jgi:type III restriction enzyme
MVKFRRNAHREYQSDFVAETADCIYMLEAKTRNEMDHAEVQSKKDAAVQLYRHATSHGGRAGRLASRYANASSNALASCRSAVSNPSVNQL